MMGDLPGVKTKRACDRCGRSGQYHKSTLIALYGDEITLPAVA